MENYLNFQPGESAGIAGDQKVSDILQIAQKCRKIFHWLMMLKQAPNEPKSSRSIIEEDLMIRPSFLPKSFPPLLRNLVFKLGTESYAQCFNEQNQNCNQDSILHLENLIELPNVNFLSDLDENFNVASFFIRAEE